MTRLVAAAIAVLALAGCASKEDIAAYASQQCEPMRKHGAAEYDRCVIQVTTSCNEQNATNPYASSCRPSQ